LLPVEEKEGLSGVCLSSS